jgi:hypothetical protein
LHPGLADEFFPAAAQHLAHRGVGIDRVTGGDVHQLDADHGRVEECAQHLLLRLHRQLGLLALRDVLVRAEHGQRFAVGRPRRQATAVAHPDPMSVAMADARFDVVVLDLASEVTADMFVNGGLVIRMVESEPDVHGRRLQFVCPVTDDLRPAIVDDQATGLDVPFPGGGAGADQRLLHPLPLVAQRRFLFAQGRHIGEARHDPVVAILLRQQQGVDGQPAQAA